MMMLVVGPWGVKLVRPRERASIRPPALGAYMNREVAVWLPKDAVNHADLRPERKKSARSKCRSTCHGWLDQA